MCIPKSRGVTFWVVGDSIELRGLIWLLILIGQLHMSGVELGVDLRMVTKKTRVLKKIE